MGSLQQSLGVERSINVLLQDARLWLEGVVA